MSQLEEDLAAFRESFGGGMLEFDRVWFALRREQHTEIRRMKDGTPYEVITPTGAEINAAAAGALLDDFVAFVSERREQRAVVRAATAR